jgi:hypothetical protein
LTSGGFFPYCALNIGSTVTGDFVSARHRTHWAFSCTEAIFKKISSSAPGGKISTMTTPLWKLHECPSLPAAKYIQLVSLLKYYSQLKSG